jgi:LmbE family N-acetylglucosaminyl deacetylase
MSDQTPRTLLAFHAHPDDEALLTSGTMARAAAEGHRVILVVATDGELGLASQHYAAGGLAARRAAELQQSAQALGVARVEQLGYADSGLGPELLPDPPGRTRFVRADTEEAATRVAAILQEEQVDVLLGYDANGGYGHPDHVKLHHVARRAAALAGTPRLLEATVPRDTICRALDLAAKIYRFPPEFDRSSFDRAFSARSEITHRINVRRHIRAKRASMRAHASQASADGEADRTLAAFLRIPRPLYDLVFGREWFVDATAAAHAENCTVDLEGAAVDRESCTVDQKNCTVDREGTAVDGENVTRPSGISRDVFEGLE